MYAARCYRTLDRPITVFGLEVEDLLALVVASGVALFVAGPYVGIGSAIGLYALLYRLKAGRPPGHVYELLYRHRWPFLSAPHLVRLQRRYSAVTSDEEEGHPIENSYWRSR